MRRIFICTQIIVVFLLTGTSLCRGEEIFYANPTTEILPYSATQGNSGELLEPLKGIENLAIKEFPGGMIFQGELLTIEDLRKVTVVSNSLEGIINLCTLHPDVLKLAAERMNDFMGQNDISGLKLSIIGNSLILTGTISDPLDVERIEKICASMDIPMINGATPAIADVKMVYFEVSFTEVNREAFSEIGVKWPASTSLADPSGIRVGRLTPAQTLEVTLDHLVYTGKARIISKPRLVCGSGQEASFQAGGELPIPKTNSEGQLTITWKPYGIILQISPTVDREGKIHTRIRSEISMVDQANAVDGIPGILTRRLETYLSLDLDQTVVLSGLVHTDDAERITKVPLLGDIPILGEIFKSKSFQKKETELIVFVTPKKRDPIEKEQVPDWTSLLENNPMSSVAFTRKGDEYENFIFPWFKILHADDSGNGVSDATGLGFHSPKLRCGKSSQCQFS